MKKTYTNLAAFFCKQRMMAYKLQGGEWDSSKRYIFDFVFTEPNRRRDLDNIVGAIKFLFDGFIAAEIIDNDGWKNVGGMSFGFRVAEPGDVPGVFVTIKEAV